MAAPTNPSASKQRNDGACATPRPDERIPEVILLHPTDSVCVAARDLAAGTEVELPDRHLQVCDDVIQGHKIAWSSIESGEPILKWGQIIGFATCRIKPGQWVHSHNM